MKAVRFSPARFATIAHNTLREAVRQRLFSLVVLFALGVVAGSQLLREFNFGSSELKFLADFGGGVLTLFGTVLAVVATAQLFFSEIESRTVLTILAKPVLRAEFILGKFAGVALVLLVFTALVAATLAGVLAWREQALARADPGAFAAGGLVAYGGLAWFALLQWLKFALIAAFTMLVASFANTNLFTVGVGFVIVVICHLQYLARDAWTHVGGGLARAAAGALGLVFPNFQLFNAADQFAAGRPVAPGLAATIAAYALIYLAVALALAVFSFRRREI